MRPIAIIAFAGFTLLWIRSIFDTASNQAGVGLFDLVMEEHPFEYNIDDASLLQRSFKGLGFGYFEYLGGDIAWYVPYWPFVLVSFMIFSISYKIDKRRHPKPHIEAGLCPTCGYDLRATPDHCPECGRIFDPHPTAHD